MEPVYTTKPNKEAFINFPIIKRSIFFLLVLILAFIIANIESSIHWSLFLLLYVLIMLFSLWSLRVRYRKEKYAFYPDKIIRNSGGILSDRETELIIKNITHISCRLPWLEHHFYKTGSVIVESAGSGGAEVTMFAINEPKVIYEYVASAMKKNGFALTKEKLIQEEEPSALGVFFEVFKGVFGSLILAFYLIFNLFIISAMGGMEYLIVFLTLIILFVFGFFIRAIIRFIDLRRRVYQVYEDTITYAEGFLTKNYSLIPIENLADASLTQTLVDKIFGLYDVKISCQGSGQEIHFKNMLNGQELERNLDKLINNASSLVTKSTKESKLVASAPKATLDVSQTGRSESVQTATYQPPPVKRDTSFTAEYKMNMPRLIIPTIVIAVVVLLGVVLPLSIVGGGDLTVVILSAIFPLVFAVGIAVISIVIKAVSTTYKVSEQSVASKYNFINQKNLEFSNEKIMGVVFKESFIDKWFNTVTVTFWSIGSSDNVVFSHIKKNPGLYDALLAKNGISSKEVIYEMDSNFSFGRMLKKDLPLTVLAVLAGLFFFVAVSFQPVWILGPIALFFIYLVTSMFQKIYYDRCWSTFYKDYLYVKKGWLVHHHFYALYENIKDVQTVKYPATSCGAVQFNVAGEHMQTDGKNKMMVSNSFKIGLIDDINTKDELLDIIFYQRPSAKEVEGMVADISRFMQQPVLQAKPDKGNAILGLLGVSILIFPLLVFLPISIPCLIWYMNKKSYVIEPSRVLAKSGIFYRRQKSINFVKVDHINLSRGAINKVFKNGKVTINTTGSSAAELTIRNIPNYKEFYEVLKQHY